MDRAPNSSISESQMAGLEAAVVARTAEWSSRDDDMLEATNAAEVRLWVRCTELAERIPLAYLPRGINVHTTNEKNWNGTVHGLVGIKGPWPTKLCAEWYRLLVVPIFQRGTLLLRHALALAVAHRLGREVPSSGHFKEDGEWAKPEYEFLGEIKVTVKERIRGNNFTSALISRDVQAVQMAWNECNPSNTVKDWNDQKRKEVE